jgi:hypothetical protein
VPALHVTDNPWIEHIYIIYFNKDIYKGCGSGTELILEAGSVSALQGNLDPDPL